MIAKNICTKAGINTQRTIIGLADAFNIPVGQKFRARVKDDDVDLCSRYNNVFFNGTELVCSRKVGTKAEISNKDFFQKMIS